MAFNPLVLVGYGFVDFESPVDAQHAVEGLQATGILAQFARVGCSVCMCVRAYVCVCAQYWFDYQIAYNIAMV